MKIEGKVAVVTGAASGIGNAVCAELAARGAKRIAMIDASEAVSEAAEALNREHGITAAQAFQGDVTDCEFREDVYDRLCEEHGLVNVCVPAAGIVRDGLSVKIDKQTGKARKYPIDTFRKVTEINYIAPIYWAMEMVARMAEYRYGQNLKRWVPEEDVQGAVIFIGSVASQGNKGQIAYASAKSGLEGAAATLMKEAIFHGVRCGVIHPGFTDTPILRDLGEDYLRDHVLPETQLGRLIRPQEIADAICFMITNQAVSGELWADAGWHPAAA
jgi:3-oxoacyl-[acyl-carrier protein] reductase